MACGRKQDKDRLFVSIFSKKEFHHSWRKKKRYSKTRTKQFLKPETLDRKPSEQPSHLYEDRQSFVQLTNSFNK